MKKILSNYNDLFTKVIVFFPTQSLLKYGGIIKPNDGKCHLDNRGQYTEGLIQDHPSLGQLSRLARDNSINVIFAVTANKVKPYEKFAEMVSEFTAGQLEGDSSNIVRLVEKQYEVNEQYLGF